jgi:mono/diheme cytochrome c family protein
MPARGWWWQRFHPALRAIVAVAYFGTALAVIVYAVTPSFHTAPASRPDITQEQASGSTTTDAGPPLAEPPLAEPPSEQDEPEVLTGGELYEINCSSCHGPSLEGGTGPELAAGSEAAEEPDSRVIARILDSKGVMSAFGGLLTDDEVDLIVEYLRELQNG